MLERPSYLILVNHYHQANGRDLGAFEKEKHPTARLAIPVPACMTCLVPGTHGPGCRKIGVSLVMICRDSFRELEHT